MCDHAEWARALTGGECTAERWWWWWWWFVIVVMCASPKGDGIDWCAWMREVVGSGARWDGGVLVVVWRAQYSKCSRMLGVGGPMADGRCARRPVHGPVRWSVDRSDIDGTVCGPEPPTAPSAP